MFAAVGVLHQQQLARQDLQVKNTCKTVIACMHYGRKDAAKLILEKAGDATAKQYKRTGAIWEFYSYVEAPEDVKRKPHTKYNTRSKDYVGDTILSL